MSVNRSWSPLFSLVVLALAACGGDEGDSPDNGSGGGGADGGGSDVDPGPVDTGGADADTGGGGEDADAGGGEDPDGGVTQPDGGPGDGGGLPDGEDETDGDEADGEEADGSADPGDVADGSGEPDGPVGVANLMFYIEGTESSPPSLFGMRSTGTAFDPPSSLLPFMDLPGRRGRAGTFVVDVTGDGYDDFVVWDSASMTGAGGIRVIAGNGDGGVSAPTSWWPAGLGNETPGGENNGFAGDVDGDGRFDLIIWAGTTEPPAWGNMVVLRSNGTAFERSELGYAGTAEAPVPRLNGNELTGDFNGDGRTDLLGYYPADGPGNGSVRIAYAGADGYTEFSNGQASDWGRVPPVGDRMLVGDLNGDGFDDLIRLFESSPPAVLGGISAALGSSTGLQPPVSWFTTDLMTGLFVPRGATAWVALDVNDDGFDDLVNVFGATPGGPGSVGVMVSNGTTFAASTGWFGDIAFGVPNTSSTFGARF